MGLGIFLIFSAIVFGFFFLIWTKNGKFNMKIKIILFAMFVWNVLCILDYNGFIIKT